jgi:hypothetical protein
MTLRRGRTELSSQIIGECGLVRVFDPLASRHRLSTCAMKANERLIYPAASTIQAKKAAILAAPEVDGPLILLGILTG